MLPLSHLSCGDASRDRDGANSLSLRAIKSFDPGISRDNPGQLGIRGMQTPRVRASYLGGNPEFFQGLWAISAVAGGEPGK